jgi:ubiquitin carboxyl-terminal hydrolase 25/28
MKRPHSADPPCASKRPSSQDGQLSVTVRAVGQTAPRLISTLKTADRQHYIDNERNPFIHPPRGYDEQFDATRRQPLHTPCKHFWTTQRNQTVLPESDIADSGQVYRLACFCQNCRWHVDLQIQHTAQPCPKQDYPLHHFTEFERDHEPEEWYRARCSGCAAQIRVDYRRPRLHSEQIDMLINVDKLQQRLKAAQQTDPDRNHTKAASPIEVLDALATYLRDAFASSDEKKIPKMNRRFLTSFGDDCKDLLASMGFKDIGEFYRLPQPEPPEPWAWGLRKQLEDTQEELWALMRQLKSNDESLNLEKLKGYNRNMEPFEEDAQLFLSTFEYDKSKTTRRAPTLTLDEQSWYAGLGCLGDFSDDLISFGFDRQIFTDKDNAPYYFDCLVAIAKKRKSETLEMKMVMLESEGHYGRQDVVNAYKYFTLDPRQANELTDLYIRGVFESRIESIPKASEAEAREKLRLIGVARGSQALLEAASNGE